MLVNGKNRVERHRKVKATREREERKCAASLIVFLPKKYVAKAKWKGEDAKCTSELGGEEHRENVNIEERNIEIKVKEEFPEKINVVKEIQGDNDDVPKKESSSACGKDMYEYEEGTDEVTENKEIERTAIKITVNRDIAFWPQTCSGQLLVDLVRVGPKMFQNKDEPFAPNVTPGKNCLRVMLQHGFYKIMENAETVLRCWLLYSKTNKSLFNFCSRLFLKTEQRKSSLARNSGFQKFGKLN